jgi:hypothetical protein
MQVSDYQEAIAQIVFLKPRVNSGSSEMLPIQIMVQEVFSSLIPPALISLIVSKQSNLPHIKTEDMVLLLIQKAKKFTSHSSHLLITTSTQLCKVDMELKMIRLNQDHLFIKTSNSLEILPLKIVMYQTLAKLIKQTVMTELLSYYHHSQLDLTYLSQEI